MIRPGARIRWPYVVRPDSTPKRVKGMTIPSKSARTEWTGRTQSGLPSPHRIILGKVIFVTIGGRSSAITSGAGRPGIVFFAET